MNITLKNYNTEIPKLLLKKAEKKLVRECDENPKGVFTAYVDDGDDTFDVSLTINVKEEIIKDSCDCLSKIYFCIHKVALVVFLVKGSKTAVAIKAKKITKTEALLQQTDHEKLKNWVREILFKNKDLELTFTHYFSEKEEKYTIDEVNKITTDAAKAIIKNKKNVDPTTLKKLVDVWKEVQSPFVQYYINHLADDNAFSIFQRIVELGENYHYSLYVNSNKIPKYLESLFQKTIEPINLLQNDEHWMKAVNLFVNNISDHGLKIRVEYLVNLKNIMAVSNDKRKQMLAKNICLKYENLVVQKLINFYVFTEMLYNLLEENILLDQYFTIFQPIYFNNTFNIKLIKKLIDKKQFDKALEYSKAQINANYKEEYSVPYLKLKREIYTELKDDASLAAVITILFPYSYNFNDFLFLYENITDINAKKEWRTKMLSKARNASRNSNESATEFVFQLMNYEEKYKKMIEYIERDCSYKIILQFFVPMFQTDQKELLHKIMNKNEGWFISSKVEDEKISFSALMDQMIKSYGERLIAEKFKRTSNSYFQNYTNSFVHYVRDKLKLE